jgi:hypothetical protein
MWFSGSGLVVGSYIPLCWVLVVGSYVAFLVGDVRIQIYGFLVGGFL